MEQPTLGIVARVILILVVLLVPATTAAAAAGPVGPGGSGGRVVARITFESQHHLNAVAGELDIWEIHPEDGYVVAALSRPQWEWLTDLGYGVEPDAGRTAAQAVQGLLDPRFYYFDDQVTNANGRYVVDVLREIEAAYPDLSELIDVGDAWMADQPGEPHRDLWVLRVTREDAAHGPIEEKPGFFLSAAMHAREVATAELVIRYLWYLTGGYDGEGGYGVDPDVTWLVDHHVAYVLVMQNPDGHADNERDVSNNRRKNMDWDDGCPIRTWSGVDLNRNHSFLWGCCGGSSSDPCSETYRGPAAGSEPETAGFEAFVSAVLRDQNGPNGDNEIAPAASITTTGLFISLHSYGDLVLWPWAFDTFGNAPNHAELQTIGRKFASFNGYDATGTIHYDVDGAIDDWVYGKLGIPSFTFEVGPVGGACGGFFPSYDCIDGYAGRDFWAENRPALLYAHKIAGSPYHTAYGPDVPDVTVTPSGQGPAASLQITATLGDQRCCGDTPRPIAGAELFVDAAGEPGTGIAMMAVDGGWGGTSEEAVAALDPTQLSAGRHLVLVHGQSDEGVWGPFSAAFLPLPYRVYLPAFR